MSRSARWFPFVMALAGLCAAPGIGHAATFVVTSAGDASDANTADNVCAISGGGCTLRAAIQQANATAGTDVINFGIGTGPQTISPASALPTITGTVTIDGRTQPGASPPAISLNGGPAGAGVNGLVLAANGCAIYGLVVRNFSNHGIVVNSSNNAIGEPVSGGGNVISDNLGSGIFLSGAHNNVITNNIIGLAIDAAAPMANREHGILLQASNDNTIGGSAQNIIAANANIGVAILSGQRNRVRTNMMYVNGGIAIDLDRDGVLPFDGVTFNDSNDGDTGANGLLNAPILTHASTSSVVGRLETVANTSITVDLYRDIACDPTLFGEGATYFGSTTVTTNANGVAFWGINIAPFSPSDVFTATATDASLNTSELSQCITIGRYPLETLTVFNPSASSVSLISTTYDPLSSAPGAFTSYVPGAPGGPGKWLMGDWDGDGIDTPAVYQDSGVFRYTNDVGATGNWTALWFGLLGKPPVAGRFNPALPNDCIGVVDNAPMGADDAFNLYYTCDLTSGPNPAKLGQWLSLPLPTSQGFSGTHQFDAGDFDNNGVDSIAVRRGTVITWTNVAPSSGHALFSVAQFIGVPPGASGAGNFVVGDWNGDGVSSFGLYYQDGVFQRRNDLDWNSGSYVLQRVGQPLGTPTTPASWRPGGSQP